MSKNKKILFKSKKPEIKEVKEVELEAVEPLADIIEKRNALIQEIKGKLLTNRQLIRGGSDVRSRHSAEISAYQPVIGEINDLGRKLSLRPVGLGQIRKA